MSRPHPDGLNDAIHARHIHRTLAGPKPETSNLAPLIGPQAAPEPAPPPGIAQAQQHYLRTQARKFARKLLGLSKPRIPRGKPL